MATGFSTRSGPDGYRLNFDTDNLDYYLLMQKIARHCVDGKPAADVAPVVHGEWIRCNASLLTHCQCGAYPVNLAWYRCSVCGRTASKKEPYCHCGAKMDGGAHETD